MLNIERADRMFACGALGFLECALASSCGCDRFYRGHYARELMRESTLESTDLQRMAVVDGLMRSGHGENRSAADYAD